jgi:DNA polymerase-1
VDFSGIENRLTAYFANDSERMARFVADPDFSEHKWAASMFFNYPIENVVKDNRPGSDYWKAKKVVHGVNYGMGPKKIANMYAMDFYEARELVNKWKSAIPRTSKWQEETAALAKSQGYLTTPFGRKRWFYTQSYYTESLSFLPQSTAADIIFRAMLALMYERVGLSLSSVLKVVSLAMPLPTPAQLLLQVHDSLLFQFPKVMRDEVCGIVKRVMTQPFPELGGMSFPITMEIGDSWAELKKYE